MGRSIHGSTTTPTSLPSPASTRRQGVPSGRFAGPLNRETIRRAMPEDQRISETIGLAEAAVTEAIRPSRNWPTVARIADELASRARHLATVSGRTAQRGLAPADEGTLARAG